MNKIVKIIFTLIMMLVLMFTMSPFSKAATGLSLENIINDGNDFLTDSGSEQIIDGGNMKTLAKSISGILLTIAIVVTLISAVVMAINFVFQSVEDKAKIKEAMVPWIIGIFISFGAYAIWKLTMSIFYQF